MRDIAIDGTVTAFRRLRKIDQIADYGLELTPEDTAPFVLSWDPVNKVPSVRLGRTPVARLNLDGAAPRVMISNAYPEKHDAVILRAFRNAVSLTDRMEKMRQAQKDVKESLLTATFEPFEITLPRERLHQAILGAEMVDSRVQLFRPVVDRYRQRSSLIINLKSGNNTQSMDFQSVEGVVTPQNNRIYYPRKDAVLSLLDRGLAVWDTHFSVERLHSALSALPDLSEVDMPEINAQYAFHLHAKTLHTKTPTIKIQNLVLMGDHFYKSIFFEKFRIMNIEHGNETMSVANIVDLPDPQLLDAARKTMDLMWKAKALGADVTDFPKISTEKIDDLLENIDFGYTL